MSNPPLPEGAQTLAQWLDLENLPSRQRKRLRHRQARQRKAVAFLDLPRRERRRQTVSIGWKIQSDGQGRGVFYDHIFLPGWKWPADLTQGDGVCLMAHPVFLAQGKQPAHYYRASVVSAAQKFVTQIENLAEESVRARLSDADRETMAHFNGYYFLPNSKGGSSQISLPHPRLESLGDRTLKGAQAAWLRDHWDQLATLVTVHLEVKVNPIDRDWGPSTHGVWIAITTDEPNLTVDALVRVIDDFRAQGERDQAPTVAAFEPHRPIVEAMLRATLWRWDRKETKAQEQGQAVADPTDPRVLAAFSYGSSPMRGSWRRRKKRKK